MTLYERLYYNLCRPAFTDGKFAKSREDQLAFKAARTAFILGHIGCSIVTILTLVILYRKYVGPLVDFGWLMVMGVLFGLLIVICFTPPQARLIQLEKSEQSKAKMHRFLEMLLINIVFISAIPLWGIIYMSQLSYLLKGCVFCG